LTNEIVVNSTGDLPNLPNKDPNGCCCDTGRKLKDGVTPECTLRAAIEFANERPGKDTIKFAIPGDDPGMKGGVPSIQPQTALPDVTDPLIIDGWSQSPASARPPVELSGIDVRPRGVTGELLRFEQAPDPDRLLLPDLASGLHLIAAGCEIRGMVINAFPLCGILVDGPQTQIQGNFLGTDFSGTGSAPSGLLIGRYIAHEHQGAGFAYGGGGAQLCLRSPYNLIGGTDAKARNVISGGPNQIIENGATRIGWVGPPGLVALGTAANGNVIQGNTIGLDESGSHPPIVPPGYTEADVHGTGQYGGVWIHNGSGNQVGGSSPGAGNIIAGNVTGVLVTGESASNNVVAGNQIGWSQNFMGGAANRETGVSLEGSHDNTVGGSDPGAGNTIGSALGIYMGGGRNSVQGNWIGISPDGAVKLGGSMGVLETGSTSQILSNVIANLDDTGLQVQFSDSSRVFGNKIIGCGYDGVRLFGGHGVLISHNSILGNGHSDGMGAGIRVQEATGVTISENSIDGSGDLGISSGPYGAKPTKGSYPALYYRPPPLLSNGQLKIGGEFTGLSGATYLLEFFANEHANPNGYGEGQTFIGSAAVTTSLTGHGVIDVTLPAPHDPGNYVTATATAPDGGTSEFSNAALIEDCAPGTKGVCPGVEQNVPNLSGGPGARALFPASAGPRSALPQATTASGDGNSDGIQDSQQPNVASLPSIAGVWVTLAAPSGTVLENVTPTGPPDFGNVPSGYTFPLGFLSFGITNLPANGVVVVTNFLHLDAAPAFSYAATTFFNYGPTPDNPTPHWYEFNFDGTTGAELFGDRIILHFRDGARGDHDLTANGEIVTVGAPACQIPSGPPLQLLSTTVDWVDTVGFQLDTNGAPVSVTNQTAMANCVLSWPASATNWTLYFKDDLTSSDSIPTNSLVAFLEFFWQPVPELPVVVNGQNVVTNTAISQSRFYRLMPSSWSAGLTTEELAQGTYSWTGTGAWSDPANWSSTALAGGAPLTNGLQIIDVVFPAGASAITSVVDGPYAVRSLSIPAGAPSVDLQSGGARASLTLGAGGLVQQGAGSTTIQPPVILTVDETWLVETGALTVASLNLGSHSLTVTGAGHLVVQDLAGGAASRLAANGPGQVDLGDAVPASSFLGTLAVAGGSVTSSQAMLNFASAVELSGGTLNLPLNAILNSTTAWQVSGGEVVLNGASGNLGPLQLSGAAALGLGSGTGSLTFASATLATTNGQLTVYDWQGAGGVSGTGGKLFVQVAPTAAWLAQVNFVGADFDVGALRLASGEIVPIPKPPSVLPADALAQFQAYGTGLTKTIVAVSGQTFSQAMHIDTTQKPAQAYNSGVVLHTSAAVAANDNLQARFWIRRVAPASGSAQVQFNFELASGTFDKSVQFPITLTDGQWQLKSVKFKSRAAYAAGAAEASFWAGYGVQTVEIGGLEVLNYRGTTPP
jgi:hypothetical protein